MTNDLILKNLKAVLGSLPPTAQVDAQFKLCPADISDARPSLEDHKFSAGDSPELDFSSKHIERIFIVADYAKKGRSYCIEMKLYNDGRFEAIKEFGPEGETTKQCPYPACYPSTEQIEEFITDDSAIFMSAWLRDFFTLLNQATGFRGVYAIGGGGLEKGPEVYTNESPEAIANKLLSKARRTNRCATVFEAKFERNSTRSDFIDEVTVTVKPNRHVIVKYITRERDNIRRLDVAGKPCRFGSSGPLIIGNSREGTELALASTLFPDGFAERKPQDFCYRLTNFSEQTIKYLEWPNRQYNQSTAKRA